MSALPPEVRELLAEATKFDGTPPVSDQSLLAASQGKRTLVNFDGEAVGIIGEAELDLVVRPSSRGKGLGSRALAEMLDAWKKSLPETHAAQELRAWVHGANPAAQALLQRAGFTAVRTLLRMTLDPAKLPHAIATSRPLPDDFQVVSFDPEDASQADDWVEVNAAAFATHPEQGSLTREDFDQLTAQPWFDADDLRLAYTTTTAPPELAAFAWVKTTTEAHDDDGRQVETELYALGAAPKFAGQGLGAAMLGETLKRMATHDPDRITLYVEGDNAQALPLYERAGFEIEQRSTQWRLVGQRE